tara:strand:- start:14401 stop:14850 length:450 start_codon:yes stop_codon:yes gene_type:complete
LNYLLSINKAYLLIISFLLFFIFLFFIYLKYISSFEEVKVINGEIISKVDITEPKFAINGSGQKIIVTAKEGNFVGINKVLLKRDVKFESKKFIIETSNVIFDRENQTASSNTMSKFNAKKTEILAEGFDIYDKGNKIKFYGNATIILK